jgi:hypothetical protein
VTLIDRLVRNLTALLAFAGLLVSGCGGMQQTSTGPGGKASYIARADAICQIEQTTRERLEGRVADLVPITGNEARQVAGLLRREADARRTELRRLRALGRPRADPRTVASFLSFLGDEITHLAGWARAYDNRDEEGIRTFQLRIADDSAKAAAVAQHYGFQVCGGPEGEAPGSSA